MKEQEISSLLDFVKANWKTEETSIDQKEAELRIRIPWDSSDSKTVQLIKISDRLNLETEVKQTSLEDVFVMDGEFDKYEGLDMVGSKDLSESWRQLIDTKRNKSFIEQYRSMLNKNILVGTKTSDYLTKLIVQSLIPSVAVGLGWLLFLKQIYENQSPEDKVPLNCAYLVLTFGVMEYAFLLAVNTSTLFRLEELENRC